MCHISPTMKILDRSTKDHSMNEKTQVQMSGVYVHLRSTPVVCVSRVAAVLKKGVLMI